MLKLKTLNILYLQSSIVEYIDISRFSDSNSRSKSSKITTLVSIGQKQKRLQLQNSIFSSRKIRNFLIRYKLVKEKNAKTLSNDSSRCFRMHESATKCPTKVPKYAKRMSLVTCQEEPDIVQNCGKLACNERKCGKTKNFSTKSFFIEFFFQNPTSRYFSGNNFDKFGKKLGQKQRN